MNHFCAGKFHLEQEQYQDGGKYRKRDWWFESRFLGRNTRKSTVRQRDRSLDRQTGIPLVRQTNI